MSQHVLLFLRASLIYFLAGLAAGLWMAAAPDRGRAVYLWLPAHAHLNLIGFLGMMVFGVGYHLLPRFSGRPLYSPWLARMHFLAANAGLAGMTGFFVLERANPGRWTLPLALAGALQALGGIFFVLNIWKTLPRMSGLDDGGGCGGC